MQRGGQHAEHGRRAPLVAARGGEGGEEEPALVGTHPGAEIGGRIVLESEVGKGSRFELVLPAQSSGF